MEILELLLFIFQNDLSLVKLLLDYDFEVSVTNSGAKGGLGILGLRKQLSRQVFAIMPMAAESLEANDDEAGIDDDADDFGGDDDMEDDVVDEEGEGEVLIWSLQQELQTIDAD